MDAVTDEAGVRLLEPRFEQSVRISAVTGCGVEQVVEAVRRAASGDTLTVLLHVPAGDGKAIAAVDSDGRVLERRYVEDRVEMEVVMDRPHLDRLLARHPAVDLISTNGQGPPTTAPAS